ncbi:MAG: Hsp20/alpha crystallin family protein [Myxococcota bacterium]
MIHWSDFDRGVSTLDEMRRQMDRLFDELSGGPTRARRGVPRAALYDTEDELVLAAELPGVEQDGVDLTIHQDVLTLRAERTEEIPEGYRMHRQERPRGTLVRTVPLPTKVDSERTVATLRDGMLEVRMAKRPEAKPRRITVQG